MDLSFLDDETPAEKNARARRLLEIRQLVARASTAKFNAYLKRVQADGRIRSLLMFNGASTGRWTAKGPQLQNLPQRGLIFGDEEVPTANEAARLGLAELYGDVLGAAQACLRGMLVAAPGHQFICADYSAIEGRVLAWLADEKDVLDAYIGGLRLYCVAAAAVYNVPYEKIEAGRHTEKQYKKMDAVGKVIELACIAEGQEVLTDRGLVSIQDVTLSDRVWDGVEWVDHEGVEYRGVKDVMDYDGLVATPDHLVWLDDAQDPVPFSVAAKTGRTLRRSGSPEDQSAYPTPKGAARVYDIVNAGPRHRFTVSGRLVHNCGYQGSVGAFRKMEQSMNLDLGLDDEQIKGLITAWRAARWRTVNLWRGLEEAAKQAVETPGTVTTYGRIKMKVIGKYLMIRLPSGRYLYYFSPEIREKEMPWLDQHGNSVFRETVSYWSVDSLTKRWQRSHGYGGLWTENVVQAISRDIMAHGMLNLDAAGYGLRLTVHDEVISENPIGFGSLEDFCARMTELPPWADGLPLAAEGWVGSRYHK